MSTPDDPIEIQKWVFPDYNLSPDEYLLVFASGKDQKSIVSHWETVVDWGDACSYLTVSSQLSPAWAMLGFNDSGWLAGFTGLGYGDGDDNTEINPTITVYSRQFFTIIDRATIEKLVLHMDYDDAFVAYLNGVEIARSNIGLPGSIPNYNQPADGLREAEIYHSYKMEEQR